MRSGGVEADAKRGCRSDAKRGVELGHASSCLNRLGRGPHPRDPDVQRRIIADAFVGTERSASFGVRVVFDPQRELVCACDAWLNDGWLRPAMAAAAAQTSTHNTERSIEQRPMQSSRALPGSR